jgi:hypothetical protein
VTIINTFSGRLSLVTVGVACLIAAASPVAQPGSFIDRRGVHRCACDRFVDRFGDIERFESGPPAHG